jgi:hypothetical protein
MYRNRKPRETKATLIVRGLKAQFDKDGDIESLLRGFVALTRNYQTDTQRNALVRAIRVEWMGIPLNPDRETQPQ